MVHIVEKKVLGVCPFILFCTTMNVTILWSIAQDEEVINDYQLNIGELTPIATGYEPVNEHSIFHSQIADGRVDRMFHPALGANRSITLGWTTYKRCYFRSLCAGTFQIERDAEYNKTPVKLIEVVEVSEEGSNFYVRHNSYMKRKSDGAIIMHGESPHRLISLTRFKFKDYDYVYEPYAWPYVPSQEYLDWSDLDRKAPSQSHWGNMSIEAGNSLRPLNNNMLMYLIEAMELPKFASSLVENGIRLSEIAGRSKIDGKFLRDLAKETSSLFLSQYYGTRLTAADTAEIANAIDRITLGESWTICGKQSTFYATAFGKTDVKISRRVTAVVNNISDRTLQSVNTMNMAIDNLNKMIAQGFLAYDLLPTTSNLWDMIPFSFVVDWLVPIGELLSIQEDRAWLDSFRVKKVSYSESVTWTEDRTTVSDTCDSYEHLPMKLYRRKMADRFLYMPILDYQPSLPNHWLEATALILANR